MGRIRTPYYEIRSIRFNEDNAPYPKTIVRAYKREDGKFIPFGWHVTWSDRQEFVYFDDEIPSDPFN